MEQDSKKDEGELLQNGNVNIPTEPATKDGNNEAETDGETTVCGLGNFQPSWLQKFASKKTYVIVFGLMGAMQLAVSSYFISTISTLEKRFKIPSRTTGVISCAWEIGGLSTSLLLTYLGSRGHKTRWVAAGFFLAAVTCFILYLPHAVFGPGEDALHLTLEYGSRSSVSNFSGDVSRSSLCNSQHEQDVEDCSLSSTAILPAVILFLGYILLGVGTSTYYTLGVSYMDDNVRKNKSPFLLGVWMCIRLLGPTVGFLLGSYVLRFYVDPSLHPTVAVDDPRWIGAWWLGWIPLGITVSIFSFMFALFPKRLPRAAKRDQLAQEKPTTKSLSDFKNVLRRLLNNKILVFNSFSSVCFMFGYTAYWTFMPKYMETQFRQSASSSNLITGSTSLIFAALGILASGTVISVFKPGPRYLAGWNVLVEMLDVLGHFSYSFLSCAVDDLHGRPGADDTWDLTASCNTDCDCGPMVKYSPVCASDGNTTFYSPCHAGCTTMDLINGTNCVGDGSGWTKDGACPVDCNTKFTIFLVLMCTMRFFSASGRAGNTIIHFRCVNQDDKSMSIGLTEALLCSLAFIPSPVIYGIILDSACIVWGQTCGQTGNCWLYNGQRLGYFLNCTASVFILIGTLLDIGVWYHVKDLKIYDEDNSEKNSTNSNS